MMLKVRAMYLQHHVTCLTLFRSQHSTGWGDKEQRKLQVHWFPEDIGMEVGRAGCHRKNVTPFRLLTSRPPFPHYTNKWKQSVPSTPWMIASACRCILFCSSIIAKGFHYLDPTESLIFLSVSWPVLPAWRCVLFTSGAIKFLTCVSCESCS